MIIIVEVGRISVVLVIFSNIIHINWCKLCSVPRMLPDFAIDFESTDTSHIFCFSNTDIIIKSGYPHSEGPNR